MMDKRSSRLSFFFYGNTLFFFYFAMGIFISILTLYLTDEGLSTNQLSFVVSATAIFTVIIQPAIGFLADKVRGNIRVITCFWIICILAGISFIFTGNVVMLFLLNGITQSIIISTMTLLDNLISNADFPYGHIRLWGSLGYAASVQLTGLLYDHLPHQVDFILFGCSLFLALLTLRHLRDIPRVPRTTRLSNNVVHALLGNKRFLLYVLLSFFILGMHYCNISYMPVLVEEVGGTATTVGTILMLQTLCELPEMYFSDKIIQFLGLKGSLLMIGILNLIRWFLYSCHISTAWMTGLFFFQAMTVSLFFVWTIKLVKSVVEPSYVNSALSIGNMAGKGLGALGFQLIGGQLLGMSGTRELYLFLSGISLATIFVSILFPKTSVTPERKESC